MRHVPFSMLAGALLLGCGDDQDPRGAHELLNRVRRENYPATWSRAPGWPGREPSTGPHAGRVEIWINPRLEEALRGAAITEWPVGSVIVKDGYTSGGRLELQALMEKREDGWFWAEFFGEDPKFSGRPAVCVDCHRSGDDHVLAFDLPR